MENYKIEEMLQFIDDIFNIDNVTKEILTHRHNNVKNLFIVDELDLDIVIKANDYYDIWVAIFRDNVRSFIFNTGRDSRISNTQNMNYCCETIYNWNITSQKYLTSIQDNIFRFSNNNAIRMMFTPSSEEQADMMGCGLTIPSMRFNDISNINHYEALYARMMPNWSFAHGVSHMYSSLTLISQNDDIDVGFGFNIVDMRDITNEEL